MLDGLIKTVIGVSLIGAEVGTYLSNSADKSNGMPVVVSGWLANAPVKAAPTIAAPAQAKLAAPVQSVGYGREELKADSGGQYQANIEIEGARIPMLVDTGATLVSLTYDDASRLGFAPAPSDYTVPVQTANGIAKAAKLTIREVRLGTLMVTNVQALVMPRDVKGVSLLGMSFLQKLGAFEIASNKLSMRQ